MQSKARTVVGGERERRAYHSSMCDPESELRLGREERKKKKKKGEENKWDETWMRQEKKMYDNRT